MATARRCYTLLGALAIAAACGTADESERLGTPRLDESYPCLDTAADYQPAGTSIHDRYAEVARITPGGFAGVYMSDQGGVALLVDPSLAEQAEPVLERELRFDIVTFRKARYDFLQLSSCNHAVQSGGIWNHPSVTVHGAGIDESENDIVLMVEDPIRDEPILRRLIQELRVPQDMVRIIQGGPIELLLDLETRSPPKQG